MTLREQDIFTKRTAKDKVMHQNLLTLLNPEKIKNDGQSDFLIKISVIKNKNANQQGMYLKAEKNSCSSSLNIIVLLDDFL